MIRRYGRAGLVALAVLAFVIYMHRANPDRWSGLAGNIQHSLHGPGFAALAVALFLYLRRRIAPPRNYVVAAGIIFGVGVLSEIAQIPGPRDAQFSDLAVNGLGIVGALGVIALFDRGLRARLSRVRLAAIGVVAVPALLYACLPTVAYTFAWASQLEARPELVTFEHAWERLAYYQPNTARPVLEPAPDSWPVAGSTIAHSREEGRWGIFLSVHPPRDWTAYSRLSFVAATPGDSLAVALGLWDMRPESGTEDNRYYTRIGVTHVPQRFVVEFDDVRAAMDGRPFDFAHVRSLVFSASKPGDNAELLLDDIRLEP